MSNQSESKRELTRSERVRARRQAEKRSQKRTTVSQNQSHARPAVKKSTAANPFARPVNQPVRKSHSVEGNELTKPSVNRRITIPLNQQGAEIEFSTLPVMNLGWRLLSAIVAAAAVAALIFLSFVTRIETTQILGLSPLLTNEVRYYLKLEDQPLFMVEPKSIQEQIENAFPEIESINIDVQFPNQVIINATAREPIYAWVIDDYVYMIDNQGVIYPAEPGTSTAGLIFVDADVLPEMKLEFDRSEDIIIEILEYTESNTSISDDEEPTFESDSYTVDPSVLNALEQILLYLPSEAVLKFDERHGFGWQDKNGWDAYFGFELEQIDMKIDVYNSIVKNISYQGLDVSLISVEYVHAPYYRED